MRIGIDARMYGQKQTGIGIYIENLIKNILKLDSENGYILFCRDLPEDLKSELGKYKNVKIVDANYSWYSFGEQIFFPFKIWRAAFGEPWGKLDLMHFPHFNAPIFCSVKFVVTIHDMTPKYFPGNKVGKSFFRRKMFNVVMRSALKNSEKIIAVSNFTKEEILKFFPKVKKEKIEVIYEGLREDFFYQIPAQSGHNFSEPQFAAPAAAPVTGSAKNLLYEQNQSFSPAPVSSKLCPDRARETTIEEKFIFYTGVWRNHKNLVGLVKAFKILKEKHKIPHKLVLGGSEDPSYSEVREEWEKLGLEKDIVLTGFLSFDDQKFLYQTCDLYVQPSFSEGFSFTPLEAMSQGAVVALSDIPVHREISGDLPIYFDPGNPEDMAEKIYFALTDKNFREIFLSQGMAQAKKYQWQDCAKNTLTKIYHGSNFGMQSE